MNYDILIPSCKPRDQLEHIITCLEQTTPEGVEIIHTGFEVSAATNRNYALEQTDKELVIMIDDDMVGFYPGWSDLMVAPLQDKKIIMISARLLKPDGSLGIMMNIPPDLTAPLVEVPERAVPTACIAFRNDGTRFDEMFPGSSWEDLDFCFQLQDKYPIGRFYINNDVKLIHLNEMKNQQGGIYESNKAIFKQKWIERERAV